MRFAQPTTRDRLAPAGVGGYAVSIAPRRPASAALAGNLFMAGSPTRIAVFIDWQNAYKAAREVVRVLVEV
jgi:hypothetical protein